MFRLIDLIDCSQTGKKNVKQRFEHEEPIFISIMNRYPFKIQLHLFTRKIKIWYYQTNGVIYFKVLYYFFKYNNEHFVRSMSNILK